MDCSPQPRMEPPVISHCVAVLHKSCGVVKVSLQCLITVVTSTHCKATKDGPQQHILFSFWPEAEALCQTLFFSRPSLLFTLQTRAGRQSPCVQTLDHACISLSSHVSIYG